MNRNIRFSTAALLAALLGGCTENSVVRVGSSASRAGAARDVPASARVVAEGVPPLSFFFDQACAIYIYDRTTDSLIHTAQFPHDPGGGGIIDVNADRRMVIVRAAERAEGQSAEEMVLVNPIDPKHRFTIWFKPLDSTERQEAAEAAESSVTTGLQPAQTQPQTQP